MKRKQGPFIPLLLSVCLALTAGIFYKSILSAASVVADPDQEVGSVTVGELQKANERSALCQKYDHYAIHTTNWLADESKEEEDCFVSQDRLVVENAETVRVQDDRMGDVYGYDKVQKKGFRYLFMDGAFDDFVLHNPVASGFDPTGKETYSSNESADGKMTVTAVLSDLTEMDAGYFDYFGYSKNEIQSMTVSYVFDAATKEAQTVEKSIDLKDGSRVNISSSVFTYGGESYVPAASVTKVISGKKERSFTLTADPGTAREKVYTQLSEKGSMIIFYPYNGYRYLYKDAACTDEYINSESDDQKNIMVYTTVK